MQDYAQPTRPKLHAAVLASSTLLAAGFVSHHPTISSSDPDGAIAEILAEAGVNGTVHGSLIVILGLWWLSVRTLLSVHGSLGMTARIGLFCYGFGLATTSAAAMCSGFLAPEVASNFASAESTEGFLDLLRLVYSMNQTADRFGMLGMTLGVVLLTAAMLRQSRAHAWVMSVGLAATCLSLVILLARWSTVGVSEVWIFLGGQAVWNLGLAALTFLGQRDQPSIDN
ncbi:MAG: hypothetical protein AAGB51_09870 [Planctomycetota bacterium]